jgi:DNA-binding CsgD family transcriptional regulator
LATVVALCTGSPVPFDAPAIERQLSAARSVDALANAVCKVVFDLFDHCALVVRVVAIDGSGEQRLIAVNGDRALASSRGAVREKALRSGRIQTVALGKPAGFRLVATPLHDADAVIGLLECVVPHEMIKPKAQHLDFVARASAAMLVAWRHDAELDLATNRALGTSFALGLRLASTLNRAGELGAATRAVVELLARELDAPVVAWRVDDGVVWLSATAGVGSSRRSKFEGAELAAIAGGDRGRAMLWLRDRAAEVFGHAVTIVDGGPIVLAARGHHAELELCGRELASLLGQLPSTSGPTVVLPDGPAIAVELARLNDLTPREREILALLAGGATTNQIADRLVISNKTVKTHVQNILRKLGASSRLEAAALAVRAGYVSLSAS